MEDFSTSKPSEEIPRHNPITLTMLFYALTLAGILAACFRYISVGEDVTKAQFAISSTIGGVVGFSIGMVQLFRRNSHAWLAPVLGLFLGVAMGPLLQVQLTHFGTIIGLSFVGSWILVLIMSLTARLNQRLEPFSHDGNSTR